MNRFVSPPEMATWLSAGRHTTGSVEPRNRYSLTVTCTTSVLLRALYAHGHRMGIEVSHSTSAGKVCLHILVLMIQTPACQALCATEEDSPTSCQYHVLVQ